MRLSPSRYIDHARQYIRNKYVSSAIHFTCYNPIIEDQRLFFTLLSILILNAIKKKKNDKQKFFLISPKTSLCFDTNVKLSIIKSDSALKYSILYYMIVCVRYGY